MTTGQGVSNASGEGVWSEQNTSPERVDSALREMLRERHSANRTLAPARVLNLVVIVAHDAKREISDRLDHVGRYHASRTIVCAVEEGRQTIDATAVMNAEDRPDDGLGVLREYVELDIGTGHLAHVDTIIDPVLVSELPTLLWAPHGHEDALDVLLEMVDVILLDTDALAAANGLAPGINRAAALREHAYVVDLAWVRTTPWRERLAAGFDDPSRRDELARLDHVCVRHHAASPVSGLLLAGWLCSRLGWSPRPAQALSGRLRAVAIRETGGYRGEVSVELAPVDLAETGIAGVTVGRGSEFSLSLDRAEGGLHAHEQRIGDPDRDSLMLRVSRGEGGILGQGVRQALLRDPTYEPALRAARSLAAP